MKRYVRFLLIFVPLLIVSVFVIRYSYFKLSEKSSNNVKSEISGNVEKIEKQTIVFSYGGNDIGGSMKATINMFRKAHPDLEVKVQQLPNSTDYQRNFYKLALYSGDSSIDVFYADIIWTGEFASANWVLPLDSYVDESMKNEFLPNALEGCKYNGKLYAIPGRTDIPLLYYRSDIIPTPPKTYMELVEMSKKYRKRNGIKYGYVFQGQAYEGLVCNALEFIWNNGGDVIKDNKVVINSPQSIEGLQQLIDIVNSDVATPDVLNFQEEDARIAFQDGNALFMRNWPYCYNPLASSISKVKGKFNVAPLPLGPQGKVSRGAMGGWNYMINKNTKNPQAAWEFVKWMTSYDMQVVDSSVGGYLPTRKDAYNDPKVLKTNIWIPDLKYIFENAKIRPVSPNYSSISEVMQQNFSNAIQCKISAKEAIENIEKDLIKIYSLNQNK